MGTRLAVLMFAVLGATACATERLVPADPSAARYELREWPRGSVAVAVEDTRSDRMGDSDRLVGTLRTVVSEALAAARHPGAAPEELRIAIRDHSVHLKGHLWNGHTLLRAELRRDGRILRSWEAFGEDRRWDRRQHFLPSFADAEDALDGAFAQAVADLMAQLTRRPPP